MTSAVSIRGLTKTYRGSHDVAALRGVDLDIAAGALVAVLGPSGCGKTTLLRIIAGFETPDAGSVSIDGTVVAAGSGRPVPPERRHVGIVPQDGSLFPHLDVARNIAFGLSATRRDERRRRVDELLGLVGLAGYAHRLPHQLSGGQQQRVALARALAPRPTIILLDEPFAALDTGLRASLRDDVVSVLRAEGTTAVLVTHDQSEALTTADTVAVMRDGRVVQTASPATLYHAPVELNVARFVGDAVVLPGRRRRNLVDCALGRLVVADVAGDDLVRVDDESANDRGIDVDVMIRPEQIIADSGGHVVAHVRDVHFEGHDAMLDLDLDIAPATSVRSRWPTTLRVSPGDTVRIGVTGTVVTYPSTPNPSIGSGDDD